MSVDKEREEDLGSAQSHSLAQKVLGTRKRLGLSGAEVSRRAGISPGYLSKIETGTSAQPSITVAQNLARALNIDIDELLSVTEHQTMSEEHRQLIAQLHRTELEFRELRNEVVSCKQDWQGVFEHAAAVVDSVLLEAGRALRDKRSAHARDLLEFVLSVASIADDEMSISTVRAHLGLSDVAHIQGDLATALAETNRASRILKSVSPDLGFHRELHISLYYRLAALEADRGKVTNPRVHIDLAIKLWHEAAAKRELGAFDPQRHTIIPPLEELQRISGIIYCTACAWEQAEKALQASFSSASKRKFHEIATAALSNLILLRLRKHNSGRLEQESVGHLVGALEICEELIVYKSKWQDRRPSIAYGYGYLAAIALEEHDKIANTFWDRDRIQSSREIIARVDKVKALIDNASGFSEEEATEAWCMLAPFDLKEPSISRAIENASRAWKLWEDLGDRWRAAEACLLLAGLLHHKYKNVHDGSSLHPAIAARRALEYAQETEFAFLEARVRRQLATILEKESPVEAFAEMTKSWNLFEQSAIIEDPLERARTRRAYADLTSRLLATDSADAVSATSAAVDFHSSAALEFENDFSCRQPA